MPPSLHGQPPRREHARPAERRDRAVEQERVLEHAAGEDDGRRADRVARRRGRVRDGVVEAGGDDRDVDAAREIVVDGDDRRARVEHERGVAARRRDGRRRTAGAAIAAARSPPGSG